ncbi:HlyD family type I secretion periplasmic adaptor subunit [Bradyrhizobium sp. LjRoot220]|uniref:HlyD family type I secretion periplasmic adaptor subunit n=1 Tax=Bradyrhizobium sp. LjRoot220 TaxID=3342284 RepID=UPI003ECDD1DA
MKQKFTGFFKRRSAAMTDREFLPAALEILDTPPSPVQMSLILIICGFFTIALLWAFFGRIDIIAIAQGKLQPTGRVKVIQPFETSRVLAIRGQNGLQVREGDVLVELDAREASADVAAFSADLWSYRADVLRREASIGAARANRIETSPSIAWPAEIPASIRLREERVLVADLVRLNAQVASFGAQSEQKRAERQRIATMIVQQKELLDTLQQRVNMKLELVARDAGSKSNVMDALESLQSQRTTLAQQVGQLAEAEANLDVIAKELQKTFEIFVAENAQRLAESERQAGDLAEKLVKAKARLSHSILQSPIDGVIQASTLTTVGQVVGSGEELMRVVPADAILEIECYLPNKDIGFVKEGQEAIIKIDSFPFTRYGTIKARVTRVARDAIPEPDAAQQEANPTKSGRSGGQAGAQRTQNLVFPVTLQPESRTINVDGVLAPLGAGMAVTAEIRTGDRRILEYVFSPLTQIASEAMRER